MGCLFRYLKSVLRARSKLKTTASELKSVPSWNFTPSRSLKVHCFLSGETCHDTARLGRTSNVCGSYVTSDSKICCVTRSELSSTTFQGSSTAASLPVAITNARPALVGSVDSNGAADWPQAAAMETATKARTAKLARA